MGNPVTKDNIIYSSPDNPFFEAGKTPVMVKVTITGVELRDGYPSPPWPLPNNRCFHFYRVTNDRWYYYSELPDTDNNYFYGYVDIWGIKKWSLMLFVGQNFDFRICFRGFSTEPRNGKTNYNNLPASIETAYRNGRASINWYSEDDTDSVGGLAALFGFDDKPKSFLEEIPIDNTTVIHRYARKQDASCVKIYKKYH